MQNPIFKSLTIRGWRQFDEIDLEFHDRLTILTGSNGSGKSTLLKILAGELAQTWTPKFAATAIRVENRIDYASDALDTYEAAKLPGFEKHSSSRIMIGSIVQQPGNARTLLAVPKQPQNQYEIAKTEVEGSVRRVYGLFLPSHRINASYEHIARIPTTPYSAQLAFSESVTAIRVAGDDFETAEPRTPHQQRKEALIAMNAFPLARGAVSGADLIMQFEKALKIMLPVGIDFRRLDFRGGEVILETGRGEFALDSLSGGLESIVDLLWQCSLLSVFAERFVVLLDEPENHLHPEMQRTILPNFMRAFANAQFVVATHNPLIATSVEESNLYFLTYNEGSRRVRARLTNDRPKSGSSDEALRSFFGIPTSMPLWVQQTISELCEKYRGRKLTEKILSELRKEMEKLDLDEYIPDTLVNFAQTSPGTKDD
jgi:predicted ATPase